MGVRVIYVMTHDSIGLGEDGPTHQPVEHLASLRAIPNLLVFRPADAVETAECWALALARAQPPLGAGADAAGLPTLRRDAGAENLSARGAYVLAEADGRGAVTLLATGSEVSIAMAARDLLQRHGRRRRRGVDAVLGAVRRAGRGLSRRGARHARRASPSRPPRPSAGSAMSARAVPCVGMTGFGASAPAEDLYRISASPPKSWPRRRWRGSDEAERRIGPPSIVDEIGQAGGDHGYSGCASTGSAASAGWCCARCYERRVDDIEVVAINDLGSVEANAHLLKYDSVHGRFRGEITTGDGWIDAGRGKIEVTAERDPAKLPWKELKVDVALECTGLFTKREAAAKHLEAGAKRVLISAPGRRRRFHAGDGRQQRPAEGRATPSSRTAPARPIAWRRSPMCCNEGVGIERGFMTTIHSYTGDQPTRRHAAQGSAPRRAPRRCR